MISTKTRSALFLFSYQHSKSRSNKSIEFCQTRCCQQASWGQPAAAARTWRACICLLSRRSNLSSRFNLNLGLNKCFQLSLRRPSFVGVVHINNRFSFSSSHVASKDTRLELKEFVKVGPRGDRVIDWRNRRKPRLGMQGSRVRCSRSANHVFFFVLAVRQSNNLWDTYFLLFAYECCNQSLENNTNLIMDVLNCSGSCHCTCGCFLFAFDLKIKTNEVDSKSKNAILKSNPRFF